MKLSKTRLSIINQIVRCHVRIKVIMHMPLDNFRDNRQNGYWTIIRNIVTLIRNI
jgi:hypothetical protein